MGKKIGYTVYTRRRNRLLREMGEHKVCTYCGREGNWSADHIIPMAVYKWTRMGNTKLYNSIHNIVISCSMCNKEKGCIVPNKYRALKIKPSCDKIYDKLYPAIEEFNNLIRRLLVKQNNRCGYCERLMSINEATIRRIDENKPRIEDNAILLCKECNNRWRNARKSKGLSTHFLYCNSYKKDLK